MIPIPLIMSVGSLVAELVGQGMSMVDLVKEVKKTGKVPPEQWAELKAALEDAHEAWDNG